MSRIRHYATENEIATAGPGTKLNFGGNLYMRVSRSGERAFHFRVCLNRRDTTHSIGKYPEISLAQARSIASQRMGDVVRAREEGAVAAFRDRLVAIKEKASSKRVEGLRGLKIGFENSGLTGFRNLEEAGKFLQGVRKTRYSLLPELCIWLELKLLIPSRADHLLNAMWSDLDVESGAWFVRGGHSRQTAANDKVRHVAFLSSAALRSLDELRRVTGEGGLLFPRLKKMTASSLHIATKEAVEHAWPYYCVNPSEFATFFECIALRYSLFHPTLVDGMLAHMPGSKLDYNHETYVAQLRSLAEWWGDTLDWFNFGHSRLQWGGTQNAPLPEHVRPKWGQI